MTLDIHYNVGGCYRTPREDIELAKRAVDAGFGGVWIGDHFHPWIDSRPYTHQAYPWLAVLLAEVPDVPVGVSVTCPLFRYEPPSLAQTVATLDNMFPGRFNLGLGVGEALNEGSFVDGEWPDWGTRAGMLVESIEVMRDLWNGDEYANHDGEYFSYDRVKLHTPPTADIPVHWAGWGSQSCRLGGRRAGNLITAAEPEEIADEIVPAFEAGLADAGRDRADADVSVEVTVNVGDPDELVAEIRDRGELLPKSELDNPDPRAILSVARDRLDGMSDAEVAAANNVTDDPETLVETFAAFEDAGVDRLLVSSNCGDAGRTVDALGDHVLPQFE